MNTDQKTAIVLDLVQRLKNKGSWCGETHIQKAVYFLQEIPKVPTEYGFILYKHGPFSFDLRQELAAMTADQLLGVVVQQRPYGPSLLPTPHGNDFVARFPKTIERWEGKMQFVAEKLGSKSVAELERCATALYVTLEMGQAESVERRADEVTRLKRHVSRDDALQAVREVDDMRKAMLS